MDNKTPNQIFFSVFRAVDDKEASQKYLDGHMHVLEIYGIKQITSAKTDWMRNPNMYVIIAHSEDKSKVYAGSRIQIAGNEFPIPLEDAIGKMDPNIYGMVKENLRYGAGEFCGIWNSREVAGMGLGSVFLGRASIAFAGLLNIKKLFGLAAPATYRNSIRAGFEVITSLGNNGKFYYPKEDLIATAVIIDDAENLPTAVEEERNYVFNLRTNPVQIIREIHRFGEVDIHFDLRIPNQNN